MICQPYRISDNDQAQLLLHSLTPASSPQQLLENLQETGASNWTQVTHRSGSRFYNETTLTVVLIRLHKLRIETFRDENDKEDNNTLKELLT